MPWSADPCHVCGTPTMARVPVGDGRAAICSEPCATSFAHELRLVAAVDAWLDAVPQEVEHGDAVHDARDGLLARFRRGEWRSVLLPAPPAVMGDDEAPIHWDERRGWLEGPAPKDEPTGVRHVAGDPRSPGDGGLSAAVVMRAGSRVGRVDLKKAREAQVRLVNVAFRNSKDGEPIRPRFSIPVRDDDDDRITSLALDELEAFRRSVTPIAEGPGIFDCGHCGTPNQVEILTLEERAVLERVPSAALAATAAQMLVVHYRLLLHEEGGHRGLGGGSHLWENLEQDVKAWREAARR